MYAGRNMQIGPYFALTLSGEILSKSLSSIYPPFPIGLTLLRIHVMNEGTKWETFQHETYKFSINTATRRAARGSHSKSEQQLLVKWNSDINLNREDPQPPTLLIKLPHPLMPHSPTSLCKQCFNFPALYPLLARPVLLHQLGQW